MTRFLLQGDLVNTSKSVALHKYNRVRENPKNVLSIELTLSGAGQLG